MPNSVSNWRTDYLSVHNLLRNPLSSPSALSNANSPQIRCAIQGRNNRLSHRLLHTPSVTNCTSTHRKFGLQVNGEIPNQFNPYSAPQCITNCTGHITPIYAKFDVGLSANCTSYSRIV